jgi:hypothetical protein
MASGLCEGGLREGLPSKNFAFALPTAFTVILLKYI